MTAPSTLDTVITDSATVAAAAVAIFLIADPAAAGAGALVLGILKVAPGALTLIEDAIADFKGQAVAVAPIAPQVEADVAKVEADLATPIAPPTPAPGS